MPASIRAVRCLILAGTGAALVAASLAVAGSATARDAEPPTLPPPSSAGHLARPVQQDVGNPGYHYAAAHTQTLARPASGLTATMSVHQPKQVRGRMGQHSIGQIAVGRSIDSSYLEAGWRQFMDGPRLFVYWRPSDGSNTCYNFGCGFRPKGPGLKPGDELTPDTEITLAFQHVGNRWWLKVDGRRSGYYPDRLWRGRFRGTDFAQLYGEVVTGAGQRVCADMGNGKLARNPMAAYMDKVHWLDGPPVRLHKATTVHEVHPFTYQQTSPNSFRYGGPGEC